MSRGLLAVVFVACLGGSAHAVPDREGVVVEGSLGIGPIIHGGSLTALAHLETITVSYRLPVGFAGGVMLRHAGNIEGDEASEASLWFAGVELSYHPFSRVSVDPFVGLAYGFADLFAGGSREETWNGGLLLWRIGLLASIARRIEIGGHLGATVSTWSQRSCEPDTPSSLKYCLEHTSAGIIETAFDLRYTF